MQIPRKFFPQPTAAVLLAFVSFAAGCGDRTVTVLAPEHDESGIEKKPPVGATPPADTTKPSPPVQWGPYRIYIANADGSNAQPLVLGEAPAWSPKGDEVAYARDDKVCIIGIGGTRERCVVAGGQPTWSPAADQIAFTSDEGIERIRVDGTARVLLVRHRFLARNAEAFDAGVRDPSWSPDGARIAFGHLGDLEMVPSSTFVVNVNGGAPARLTNTGRITYSESTPSWSPDGLQLLICSVGGGINTVDASGGLPTSIYPYVNFGCAPRWTPNAAYISFTTMRHSWPHVYTIWSVTAKGDSLVQLLDDAGFPSWSPDGKRFAFVRRDPPLSP